MCKVAITIPSLVRLRRAVRRWRSRGRSEPASASATGSSSSSSRPCAAVPAGHVAVCVEAAAGSGSGSGGATRRFVVRVAHLSHPAFRELLRQAEEEYGFPAAPGPIALPCDEDRFLDVLRRVSSSSSTSADAVSCCGLATTRRCARGDGESRPLLLQQGRVMAVDQKLVW